MAATEMTDQQTLVLERERRVHPKGHPAVQGTVIKGDLYSDEVTVRWDDSRVTTIANDMVALVHGQPTYLGADATYPNGDVVTADGNLIPHS